MSVLDDVPTQDRPVNVLLVDDQLGDAMLTRLALRRAQLYYQLCTLSSGSEVIEHLTQCQAQGTMPDVMLLDLNMPGVDGFEVLQSLATCPALLRDIDIYIVSGHDDFDYLKDMYPQLSIMGFMHKPCTVEDLSRILIMVKTKQQFLADWKVK